MLFPRATVVTPNLDEVRLLTGIDVRDRAGQYEAAKVLYALGPRHVLVKGGHLADDRTSASTCTTTATPSPNCPGRGSPPATPTAAATPWPRPSRPASPAACPVGQAVALAKRFVVEAVRHSYDLGAGHGPVSPLWAVRPWWRDPD